MFEFCFFALNFCNSSTLSDQKLKKTTIGTLFKLIKSSQSIFLKSWKWCLIYYLLPYRIRFATLLVKMFTKDLFKIKSVKV